MWLDSKVRALCRVRIVDGTIVREPGKTGSQWRILYSLRLPSLICDFFDVTAVIGQRTGESLNRLPVLPHELILADAGYCSIAGIEHVRQQGADVLLRVNPQSFVPFSPQGSRISLLSRLRTLSTVGQCGEWRVILRGQDSSFEGRLCALRKNDSAVEQARRRLHPRASKKQMITRPETVELAKYVLLFTTKFSGSTAQVLEFYRMRWQIELVFKRLKSLVQMGHVPKHDDCSSRPWIYGKLLIALLTQKLIRIGHDISPAAIDSRPQRPPSPWREFSFALRNIQQAIEPTVSLDRVLARWCGRGRRVAAAPMTIWRATRKLSYAQPHGR